MVTVKVESEDRDSYGNDDDDCDCDVVCGGCVNDCDGDSDGLMMGYGYGDAVMLKLRTTSQSKICHYYGVSAFNIKRSLCIVQQNTFELWELKLLSIRLEGVNKSKG